MSPYQMQVKQNTSQWAESRSQSVGQQDESDPLSILSDLKERLRKQICEHPGKALKISLLTGLFAGWWVKR